MKQPKLHTKTTMSPPLDSRSQNKWSEWFLCNHLWWNWISGLAPKHCSFGPKQDRSTLNHHAYTCIHHWIQRAVGDMTMSGWKPTISLIHTPSSLNIFVILDTICIPKSILFFQNRNALTHCVIFHWNNYHSCTHSSYFWTTIFTATFSCWKVS